LEKIIQNALIPLKRNIHPSRGIPHPTIQTQAGRQAIHKRPETNSLNNTSNVDGKGIHKEYRARMKDNNPRY